ncbi:unnamed protein product [Rangifer tarandus platyrhynchus]|uniref:Uncharacterized protein n=2 Tax=Rangifer tarandus platyrhynchus TaxID=3082113 RepID=A0AC59YNC9_RANTA|nr:unnamed protein product [Rangifer tarandus platyrhynchus]
MRGTLHSLMVHICSIPLIFPLSPASPTQLQLPDVPEGWPLSSKPTPLAQVLLRSFQSRTLDFRADTLSPGNLPHISLSSNSGQPPPLLTSLHLPTGRRGSYRPTQRSPAAPRTPHQAWLTQSPLLTPAGHSLLLILQPSWCPGALPSFLFLLGHLPLILPPELQRNRGQTI